MQSIHYNGQGFPEIKVCWNNEHISWRKAGLKTNVAWMKHCQNYSKLMKAAFPFFFPKLGSQIQQQKHSSWLRMQWFLWRVFEEHTLPLPPGCLFSSCWKILTISVPQSLVPMFLNLNGTGLKQLSHFSWNMPAAQCLITFFFTEMALCLLLF